MNKKSEKMFGLVLAGGKSRRMQKDKSELLLHGKKQVVFCYELLTHYCEKVFVSNRAEQSSLDGQKDLPQIHDKKEFSNSGPLGGILSAMSDHGQRTWFVLACDLPFVTDKVVEHLIKCRNKTKLATVYRSLHNGLPEPLCGIYEYQIFSELKDSFNKNLFCPRKILSNSNVELIDQIDEKSLENINHPNEYKEALEILKGSE